MRRYTARSGGTCALAVVLVIASAGCAKSCKNDHPYVPYSIDTSASAASTEAGAAPTEEIDAGAFQERAATNAPPGATEWTLDDVALTAPAGRTFVLGVARDFDGDGTKDALVVARLADDGGPSRDPGALFFYRGKKEGLAPPEEIPGASDLVSDPSCTPVARLSAIGKRSFFVELAVSCTGAAIDGATRWLAALAIDKSAKVKWSALAYDPPAAAKLTIDADGSDQDGDGIDDLTLRVSLEGGAAPFEPGPKVSAVFRWLDRPAGLSRDAATTESSFAQLASIAMARASRAKDAPAVPLFVAQTRALFRAMCPEGGAPRIVHKAGAASMTCGQSRALEDAGMAEARAYATEGDAVRAIAALERAQRPPATKTASRATEAEAWIAQAAPIVAARSIRNIAAVPSLGRGRAPAWGALAFEPSGKLLVRTAAGVARVDPEQGDEAAAEITVWPSAVVSPDGAMRWIEAYDPCDGLALRATFAPTNEGQLKDVALPIAPPFGPKCTTTKETVAAIPIAWGARGLEAIVSGEPVLVSADLARAALPVGPLDQPMTLGAPRSPNGRALVVATPRGLVVRGAKSRVLRARELDATYGAQRDCTVSDDGARVACVRNGRAWVGIWDAP
jgi:hypothetical protein